MVSQADALRSTVSSMDLLPEHEALVAYCEGLAEQIDLKPHQASLWREYRPAIELLLAVGDAEEDDGQAALLELVRTPVGNTTKPGSSDDGVGDRRGSRKSRPAPDAVAATGSGRRRGASA